ncbi:nuclear transport factor 2 family protein [Spirillospora sp. NBC_00431]
MYGTDEHAISAPAADTDAVVRELRDRAEIVDALHRFALGQDLKDAALFASAFAADAELDFRPSWRPSICSPPTTALSPC